LEPYAKTLAKLIAYWENETPAVTGIYGHWGSGKISLMKSIINILGELYNQDDARFRKYKTILVSSLEIRQGRGT
jgi:hypothetical protein